MGSDALFGQDGTQAPPPPRFFPDALSSPPESADGFADDQPRISVRPPGLPDPDAVQRAIDEAVAAERAQPGAGKRPRQKRSGGPGPARPPMRPMPPPPQPQPQPQQPGNPGAGCGVAVLVFFAIVLASVFFAVVGHLSR
ncbi:hypothetical protein [Allokutzneria oryzae]|uniref:Uncharacterized protein n=1 Tax=Allokutzneria oryzae TaxID=1378989 RepID=A0ABV6A178_9PSEU